MEDKKEFKPFIPADKIVPELTITSIIVGALLAVLFGGANAYLGLRVGMTVSASIPAAVISMGIIRVFLRRDSILENNMVQTIGSAGESVAAGAIFTMPALFMWAIESGSANPSLIEISLIALCGGILGVLFMIPLRSALIVQEHGNLPYPEGQACAEVLLAGEEGGAKAGTVFSGLGIAALYKFIADGLKLFPSEVDFEIKSYKGSGVGMDVLPALAGVGYICGPKVSSYLLAGGTVGWFVLMPLIVLFGGDMVLYPATAPISELGTWGIWGSYIRYIGAGAVAAGGILSLIKSLPMIFRTFKQGQRPVEQRPSHEYRYDYRWCDCHCHVAHPGNPGKSNRCDYYHCIWLFLCYSIIQNGRYCRKFQQSGVRYGDCHTAHCHDAFESYRQYRYARYDSSHYDWLYHLYHCGDCRRYFTGFKDRFSCWSHTCETADR